MAVVFIGYPGLAMQVTAATKDVQRRLDVQDDQIKLTADRVGVPASEVRVLPRSARRWRAARRSAPSSTIATGSDLTSAKEAGDRIESTGAQNTPS